MLSQDISARACWAPAAGASRRCCTNLPATLVLPARQASVDVFTFSLDVKPDTSMSICSTLGNVRARGLLLRCVLAMLRRPCNKRAGHGGKRGAVSTEVAEDGTTALTIRLRDAACSLHPAVLMFKQLCILRHFRAGIGAVPCLGMTGGPTDVMRMQLGSTYKVQAPMGSAVNICCCAFC